MGTFSSIWFFFWLYQLLFEMDLLPTSIWNQKRFSSYFVLAPASAPALPAPPAAPSCSSCCFAPRLRCSTTGPQILARNWSKISLQYLILSILVILAYNAFQTGILPVYAALLFLLEMLLLSCCSSSSFCGSSCCSSFCSSCCSSCCSQAPPAAAPRAAGVENCWTKIRKESTNTAQYSTILKKMESEEKSRNIFYLISKMSCNKSGSRRVPIHHYLEKNWNRKKNHGISSIWSAKCPATNLAAGEYQYTTILKK